MGCFVDGWVWTVVVEEDAWEGVLWACAGANLHSDGFDVTIYYLEQNDQKQKIDTSHVLRCGSVRDDLLWEI